MIDALVFDFGGVLLNLDMERTYQQLGELMGRSIEGGPADGELFDVFIKYEKGLVTDETVIWNIQRMSEGDPSPREIVAAWNAMLLGWNPKRFDMLRRLRESYKIYLLSNTNHMHLTWIYRHMAREYGIVDFDEQFFDQTFYSHLIHRRKPDADIYDYVRGEIGLEGGQMLFIDDNADNVAAAKACGWQAVQHDPKHDIIDMVENYITRFS